MTRTTGTILLALMLVGCAYSSGVLKMGPDTYSIRVQASSARGGVAGAKRMAYEEAREECTKSGREMLVVNERFTQTRGAADVTFRCLARDDPELSTRPRYRERPDVIIQDERK